MDDFDIVREALTPSGVIDPTPARDALQRIEEQLEGVKSRVDIAESYLKQVTEQLDTERMSLKATADELRGLKIQAGVTDRDYQQEKEKSSSYNKALAAIAVAARAARVREDDTNETSKVLDLMAEWADNPNLVPNDFHDEITGVFGRVPRKRQRWIRHFT